ncbi:Tetraspanin [Dirofilaria immitis]|nr:Tetraspanin [Dirofilaria immitis]
MVVINYATFQAPSLDAVVGNGTFSCVFKAVSAFPGDRGVRDTVAVKVISMQAANASKLNSDFRLYDFQWDRNNIYLIMEFCGGGDLGSFIKHYGPLPEALTRRFFVSDFGLSQYLKKNEQASSFRGSPLYMAPEIFCRGPYDSRVDLWSCGIILYECLYGVPPFTAHTYDKLLEQILSVQSINFPMNVQLSHVCLDLLQALLVRNPHDRITFEQFFTHPFVDLMKLPSSAELDKADSYVKKSQQAESEDNLVEATKLISNAVQIYIHCLELFDEGEEKERLRPVIEGFPVSQSLDRTEWDDWPQIRAAELVARTAHDLEYQERWDEALAKYTLAIESAMHVLSNENRDAQRSIKLGRKVSSWLSAAERIKLTGLMLIFLSLLTLLDPRRNYILDLVDFSEDDPLLRGASYLALVAGSVTMIIGFIGCCGTIKKSLCLLITFVICLLVLFFADVTIACLALFHRNKLVGDKLSVYLTNLTHDRYHRLHWVTPLIDIIQYYFLTSNFDKKLQSLVRQSYGVNLNIEHNAKVTSLIDRLQFNQQLQFGFDVVPSTCCVQLTGATPMNPVARSSARCQQFQANKLWRHQTQQCCGATGPHNYYDSFWYKTNTERGTISFVPPSCCKQMQEARAWFIKPIDPMCTSYNYYTSAFNSSVNAQGCHEKLLDWLTVQTVIFVSTGLSFAAFQLLGICIALSLAQSVLGSYYCTTV